MIFSKAFLASPEEISRSMYNCLKIIASCLNDIMLAYYATTELPLKQQHKSKDLVLFSKSCYQSSKM